MFDAVLPFLWAVPVLLVFLPIAIWHNAGRMADEFERRDAPREAHRHNRSGGILALVSRRSGQPGLLAPAE